jgi:predicted NAD/FAD-dependent oxidoreductase
MAEMQIAVVGAGVAGMSCAAELSRTDARISVFERSRGLGGRLATRRERDATFDHGAQFVTARSRPFSKYMQNAARSGVAAPWRPRLSEDTRVWDAPIEDWYVGVPGMSALLRPLARHVHLQSGTAVHELHAREYGWELVTDAGRHKQPFDAVAIAIPAPQALTLLAPYSRAFRHLTDVVFAPCWSAMLAFTDPLPVPAEAMRWTSGPLAWAASHTSRPGRALSPLSWVLHASPEWSRAHLEIDARDAAQALYEAFARVLDLTLPAPHLQLAHRWRYAQVEQPLGLPCLVDQEAAAGVCGDWCIAPRVEAAFESGRALAQALASMIGLSLPISRR